MLMRKGTRQCRTFPALLLAVAGATGGNDTLAAQDGLVLSGGGSRGLAHAGAIVGLERLGLRPDLVVGTSMGAVIGGLYASGMAPDSIWALTQSQDWQAMFAPSAVRPGPDGEPRRPLTRLGLFVDRARYVDGLIADWQVNRELVRLFLDASFRARGDFDALPRRFRSVAADLRTGRAVVLSSGDLARSIRASMSVPGVFAPVVMDGVPLVDGGLADYLPVGPARRAGAARVIAVDVIRPPPDEVGLNPFQSALRAFRMTLYNARQERDSADISITPVIDPDLFAAVFMRDPEPLLEAGLRAALELSDTFDNGRTVLSLRAAPVSFAALRVESNDSALLSLIRRTFEPVASRRYDRTSILDATDDLYASGLFSGVWPRVESDGAADTLVVFAEAFAPTTITSAAGYDTDRGFRGWATLTRRIGGRLEGSLGVSVGEIETWGLALLRLRPLNAMPAVSLEMGASIEANDVRLFDGDDPAGEVQITRAGGRLGTTWHALEPNVEVEALVSFEHIDREFAGDYAWGPEFRVTMPGPNAMIVGTPLRVEAVWRFGDVEYRRFRAAGSAGVHTGEFQAALVGDITVARGGAPIDEWPALGDARAVPGLRWGRLRAPSLAVAGLDFAVATPLESHTRLRLRAGTIASEPGDLGSNGWYTGAGLGILWWTPLGRLAFEAGVARGGDWLLWLDVGPIF